MKVDIGPPRTIVRMDYVHRNEEDAKTFINKVKGLNHSTRTLIIHTALARTPDLYPSEKPVVSENDFIKFCMEANSFNICSGYQIKVIFNKNELQFEFSSWNELNLFLFEATRKQDFNRAFLGLLSEDNENAHNEESRRQTIKTVTDGNNDLIYPLKVAFGSGMCRNDLENISKSSKFSIHKIDEDSKVAKVGFKTKADLFKFITSAEAKRFFKVNILNGGTKKDDTVKEDVISKGGGRGGGGGQGRGSRGGRGGGGRGEFGGRGGGPGGGGQGGGGDNRGRGGRGGGVRGGFGGRGGGPGGGGRGGGQGGRGGGGGGNRGRGGMM